MRLQEAGILIGYVLSCLVISFSPIDAQDDPILTENLAVITPDNVNDLTELFRLETVQRPDRLEVSHDGTLLAAGFEDGTLGVWELPTMDARFVQREHTDYVFALAFSPDDTTLYSGGWDGMVKQWNVLTGEERTVIQMSRRVWDITLSQDGDLLGVAAGGGEKALQIWNTQTWLVDRIVSEDVQFRNWTVCIEFSPDERLVATCDSQGVQVIDSTTNKMNYIVLARYDGDTYRGTSSASHAIFSPDGTLLAIGIDGGGMWLWDLVSNSEIVAENLTEAPNMFSLEFSPSGSLLAGSETTNYQTKEYVALWFFNVDTSNELGLIPAHRGYINDVDFSPDGKLLISAGRDRTIRFWGVTQ